MPRLDLSTGVSTFYSLELTFWTGGLPVMRAERSFRKAYRSNSIQFGEIAILAKRNFRLILIENWYLLILWTRIFNIIEPFWIVKNGFVTIVILIDVLEIAISETNLAKGILEQPVFPTQHKFQLLYEATFPNSNFKSKWYIEYVLQCNLVFLTR